MDWGPIQIGAVTAFIWSGSALRETRWAITVGYAGRTFLLAASLVVPQALDDVTTGGAGEYNTACRAALTSRVMELRHLSPGKIFGKGAESSRSERRRRMNGRRWVSLLRKHSLPRPYYL